MGKKTKQHRKSKSPKHQRPPDPQVVERSPSEHDRAIAINQQRIKNKRNNAHSITEYHATIAETLSNPTGRK